MKPAAVLVKDSIIDGKGAFALRDFKKGEIVIRRDISNTISEVSFRKMSDEEKKYITFLNGKYIIMQDPEKYINHSCTANTKVKDFCDIAVRDIKKWEEITGNYLETEDSPSDVHMICTCKSAECKKYLGLKNCLSSKRGN